MLLIAASVLASLWTDFGADLQAMAQLSIVDFEVRGTQVVYPVSLENELAKGEWWRLFTPALMHGSALHLLFNMLWIWIAGRRIESLFGATSLITLALLTGITSNVAQFMDAGPLFLGMSGVVYGLLGFAGVWDRLNPSRVVGLPPAVLGFMLLWLALGYTDLLAAMGMGNAANTAHLAGLISGVLLALLARLVSRLRGH